MSAPYRPGQPQWPDNRPQRPDRPPPIQFGQEPPPPPPVSKTLQWAMRIAGLVVVAVVSGLVWFYVADDSSKPTSSDGTGASATQEPGGAFKFTASEKMPKPDTVTDCAKHAYRGDVKTFLANNACDQLARQLFVTKPGGRTIYTSVSVVTMPDEAKAAQLRDLTDKDGSGNVSDVVRDKVVTINGLKSLSADDGYASKQSGKDVIIVEAAFAPKDKTNNDTADEKILDQVCTDALRLGPTVNPPGSR